MVVMVKKIKNEMGVIAGARDPKWPFSWEFAWARARGSLSPPPPRCLVWKPPPPGIFFKKCLVVRLVRTSVIEFWTERLWNVQHPPPPLSKA